jgi:Domain of unknown function (DUF4190)
MQCAAGHVNEPGTAFCTTCGLAIAPRPASYGTPPAPVAPQPPYGTPAQAWGSPAPQPSWVAATPSYGMAQARPENGMGTAALVLGILGLLICGPLTLLAIIFGAIGLQRANAGRANNRGAALTGLILGIVGAVLWFIIWIAVASSNSNSYY